MYTHLVGDANSTAHDRLFDDFNIGGYPTLFVDGGAEVDIAYPSQANYRSRIETCGARVVPTLDVKVAVEWLGDADLRVTAAVGFNGPANLGPSGLWLYCEDVLGDPDKDYMFEVSCGDPEGDAVQYQFDWGDEISEWLGPYAPDQVEKVYHEWSSVGLYQVRTRARDILGDTTDWSDPHVILINHLPLPPGLIGVETGTPGVEYLFEASTTDADGHQLMYQWDWDGGPLEPPEGPYPSGEVCAVTRTFDDVGVYEIRVKARDDLMSWSDWSDPLVVTIATSCCTLPGDVNDDGVGPDISDLVYLVNFMFKQGAAPPCDVHADINGDEVGPDISDLVFLVNFMFKQGTAPAACP